MCSNPRVCVSYLYYLITLLQLLPDYFIYTPFVTLSMFVALSNFRRLINLLSSSRPFLSIHFFTLSTNLISTNLICTCTTHHTHNSNSCLIVRMLSTPIYLSNSPGVSGHRTILIWGDRNKAGGFVKELNDTLHMHF